MWKRFLSAISIIALFYLIATQTPLERWIFQYEENPAESYKLVNQIQVVSDKETAETVKELENGQKKIAEKKHKNKSIPTRLELPSIHVSAQINKVGLAPNGAMDTLDGPTLIAWYQFSSIPGQEGNAILAGHRDWEGQLGTLFYLERMELGDELIITFEDGHTETFELVSNNLYPETDVPEHVMDLNGDSRITVITCAGTFNKQTGHYDSRVVGVFQKINE
ncbi:class F sortase [Virgibacillus halodenitrificans]|uniref:class F sortase n=1 Tax=Virgibacillus halodenitrificans TaxID=1482 RepID=UPI0013CEB5D9|nr:class F sortase [Virgibacillus halodenitrificans]